MFPSATTDSCIYILCGFSEVQESIRILLFSGSFKMSNTKLTNEGISTFLILVAGEILRANPQVDGRLLVAENIPMIALLEASVQTVLYERDRIEFPLPATTKSDLATVDYLMNFLKRLMKNEDLIVFCSRDT